MTENYRGFELTTTEGRRTRWVATRLEPPRVAFVADTRAEVAEMIAAYWRRASNGTNT